MIHEYSEQESRRCNRLMAFMDKKNHFLFIGDARVHQLFLSFVGHFQSKTSLDPPDILEFIDDKLKLRVNYIAANDLSSMLAHLERLNTDPPNFIVASAKFINLSPRIDKSDNYTKELEKSFIVSFFVIIETSYLFL